MGVTISLNKSPYECHRNPLFTYVKKELVDSYIYDIGKSSYPFTTKNLYEFKIEGIEEDTVIRVNGNYFTTLKIANEGTQLFYVASRLGNNEIEATNLDETVLFARYQFSCYNVHYFLAVLAHKFKQLRNKLLQATANTYYASDLVEDFDTNPLEIEYGYARAISTLLGTNRYSQFTNEEYYNFLHKVFDINIYAGVYKSFALLAEAFSDYVSAVEIYPLSYYSPSTRVPFGRVWVDSVAPSKLYIYPSYVFVNYTWHMLPFFNEAPESGVGSIFQIYCDGEVEVVETNENKDKLILKYGASIVPSYKNPTVVETFTIDTLIVDTTGVYTGFIDEVFVPLSNPLIGSISSITTSGGVSVEDTPYASYRYIPKYNLVALGTKYTTDLGTVTVTYTTKQTPLVLANVARETPTGDFTEIKKSGHSNNDALRRSYYDEMGYMVIVSSLGTVDNELQSIINSLVREILPVSCHYYLRFSSYEDLFTYWGQTNISLQDVEDLNLTFADLL